ncbi:MAG: LysM peptidoglycan-binding domain-containing protein, partial [Clostridia bacterium]|nr:LysM peptidoglycan-binding domain-containing protein [Clostridia bacterium]
MDIYTVKKGEDIFAAAKRCNLSPHSLAADNGLTLHTPLAAGQALVVRRVRIFHTVRNNETVRSIAARYGISAKAVYRMNPVLCGLPRIYAGQSLAVQMADTPQKRVQVLGLTSPCPKPLSLPAVLPFLTYISPYTCRIAQNGGLQIPNTAFLFATARDYGVLPILQVDGNTAAVDRLTETLLYAVMHSGAAGIVTTVKSTNLQARLTAADRMLLQPFPTIHTCGCDCRKNAAPVFLSLQETHACAVRHNAEIRFDVT